MQFLEFQSVNKQFKTKNLYISLTHGNHSNYERAPCALGLKEKPCSLALLILSLRQDTRNLTNSEGKYQFKEMAKFQVAFCLLVAFTVMLQVEAGYIYPRRNGESNSPIEHTKHPEAYVPFLNVFISV